jgi:hypothetical protein
MSMISFSWGRIVSSYSVRAAMLYIVYFVEKKSRQPLQVKIMGSGNAPEATYIALKYHSIRAPLLISRNAHQDN